jgi:hypothetical protein
MSDVTEKDMDKLRHMLGAIAGRYKKNTWGWRNYYAAGRADNEHMQRLVSAGLATQGHTMEGGMTYFHATVAGCKAVGLGPAGIKRAFDN